MDNRSPENEGTALKRPEAAQRFLVFSLGQERYAVPLLKVNEVIAPTDITPVPHTPVHFKGIMNLRGQVISIVDLRLKFRLAKADTGPETAIVILDLAPLSLGVVVDSVDSVIAVDSVDIRPTPDIECQIGTDFLTGVTRRDSHLILILDIEKSLNISDLKAIKHAAVAA